MDFLPLHVTEKSQKTQDVPRPANKFFWGFSPSAYQTGRPMDNIPFPPNTDCGIVEESSQMRQQRQ
jgi:hypothetical protein